MKLQLASTGTRLMYLGVTKDAAASVPALFYSPLGLHAATWENHCEHLCLCGVQVVAEANKPEWSGGLRGLLTYLQRLLYPTWDTKLATPTKTNPNSLMPNLTEATLKVSVWTFQQVLQLQYGPAAPGFAAIWFG